ncbi:hypothetical protein [Ktedonospora formicarum]|uniref:hypothetical protein n=1 Tax=Ktedonospora formicarum TaxID=2778364 RepID=UPI001C6893E7|nr:hypothetical protein [Ktedonospora formicarum]
MTMKQTQSRIPSQQHASIGLRIAQERLSNGPSFLLVGIRQGRGLLPSSTSASFQARL